MKWLCSGIWLLSLVLIYVPVKADTTWQRAMRRTLNLSLPERNGNLRHSSQCPDHRESKLYGLLQPAYTDAATGAIIQAKGIAFIENLTMDTSKDLTIERGFDPDFSAQNGYTILQGTLTVGLGSIVVDYLTIE